MANRRGGVRLRALPRGSAAEVRRQALRDVGFSDRDIWDIINVAAFFNMTNRVASGTAMHPNDQYHSESR